MSGNLRSLREPVGISRNLLREERAAISVLAALCLVAVIGISALAVEFGQGLVQRSDNQRVADLAAYGGALVFSSSGSTTDAESAVRNIAALNGLTGDGVTITPAIVTRPDGNNAMQVTVTTNLPMYLARVLTGSATLSVVATAYVEIKPGPPSAVALVQ
jgi:uncharacterized membrane protein